MQTLNCMRKYVVFCCCLWLMACAKTKLDTNLPILNSLKSSNSSIRLISIMGPDKVSATVGGVNYNLSSGVALAGSPGTTCFLGITFTSFKVVPVALPEKVLDQAGNANVLFNISAPTVTGGNVLYTGISASDTVMPDNPTTPTDYYITPATKTWADVN